ncbi:hypothetical protein [Azospirillum baldaniorum]|uniref:hypothetical protein n=1 Tax=Azospirillum baldaniorum TaxID=1064539 RepID=UPI001B3B59EF|nr:hypothetical protein [Azospirillum baldaniorum]
MTPERMPEDVAHEAFETVRSGFGHVAQRPDERVQSVCGRHVWDSNPGNRPSSAGASTPAAICGKAAAS